MDNRTFIGMVEAGEPLIQQAIDAMREYHQAQDRGDAGGGDRTPASTG